MPAVDPRELWRNLDGDSNEDAADEAARVPVAQAERELAAEGVDVAAERAKARAIVDRLAAGQSKDAALGREQASLRASLPKGNGAAAENGAPIAGDRRSDAAAESAGWVRTAEVTRLPPRGVRWPLLVAAILAALATGGILYAVGHRSKPVERPDETRPPAPTVEKLPPRPEAPPTAAPAPSAASPKASPDLEEGKPRREQTKP
jgi:hypothetical protein